MKLGGEISHALYRLSQVELRGSTKLLMVVFWSLALIYALWRMGLEDVSYSPVFDPLVSLLCLPPGLAMGADVIRDIKRRGYRLLTATKRSSQ